MNKLTGLIAAPFTAFHEDGSLNPDQIQKQADSLVADGISGVYVGGTTGEGISCSMAERCAVLEAWADAACGRLTLIAHTGALALDDVKVLSRKAADLGFQAFSVIPTTFFRPADESMLADYCRTVAAFVPELPFYYYHTVNSGVNLSMNRFLEFADGKIPNLAGIKFNHHNLYDYQNCLNFEGGKYDIVYGVDEFFAGALAVGAKCFIGSTYNYSAGLYRDIWNAFEHGDWRKVRIRMDQVCRGVKILNANGGIPAGKSMMRLKGIDCGPARLPLRRFSATERAKIADEMSAILAE